MVFLMYSMMSYFVYNGVSPQDRDCQNCSNITINGYNLFFHEIGVETSIPTVVLVHGGPGHSSLSFKNSFDFLSNYTRVVYYDQRGSGNSQIKKDGVYNIDGIIDDLELIRRDILKSPKITLVGHSFGSTIVQRYAIKYSLNVNKMFMIGGTLINNNMGSRFLWNLFGPTFYSFGMGYPPHNAIKADKWFTESNVKDSAYRLYNKSYIGLLNDTGLISFAPWFDISLSACGYSYENELKSLSIPSIYMYGVADSQYTREDTGKQICSLIPNCTVKGFSNSGHWPFLEEPQNFQDEFIKHLLYFVFNFRLLT